MWLLLKILVFTLVVPGFVAGWVPLCWLHRESRLPETWLLQHYGATPVLLAGAAIFLHCVWHFARSGRGTPAPIDAPRKLVQCGLYRWMRNPMYVGVLLLVLGEALFFLSLTLLLYAVFLASAFQLFVVLYEEPALAARFGALYSDYCNTVNRWWPRRPRL